MELADGALLAAAGLSAGAVNAVAGGGSLITFSALLATGASPLTANVTSSLGVVPGYLGQSVGYGPEVRAQRRRVRRLAVTSVTGALAGTAALLAAPSSVFELVAPVLVLASCLLLALQPRLRARPRRDPPAEHPRRLDAANFAASFYGGYFAAGLGVLLIAMLGVLLPGEHLQRLNALKGVLMLVVGGVSGAAYALLGPVAWAEAGVIAVTSLVGGHTGVSAARRVPEATLRRAIVVLGAAVAIALLVR